MALGVVDLVWAQLLWLIRIFHLQILSRNFEKTGSQSKVITN